MVNFRTGKELHDVRRAPCASRPTRSAAGQDRRAG
jgi:hypothetical protein